MPIVVTPESDAGVETVRSALAGLLIRLHSAGVVLTGVGSLEVAAPHRVFTMTANDVARELGLERATHAGWRYLVFEAGQAVASVELSTDDAGRPGVFNHLNGGPYVQATAEAIANAERLPQVQNGTFELRALRISALHVMALWLVSEGGRQNVMLPLAPAPPDLVAGEVHDPAAFLGPLRSHARAVLSPPPPPSGMRDEAVV